MTQYKESTSWQAAINLGPKLIALADDMPASEQMGLGMQLREIMVELPAAVASDLLHGGNSRHLPALKLVATLELIDHVYPALDTISAKTAADQLAERLLGAGFEGGAVAPSEPPAQPATPPAGDEAAETAAEHAAGVAPVPPRAEPSTVPVTPAEESPAPAASAETTHVQVNTDVHPDSE